MVIFLYNLYIFVWIQHFWGPSLNYLISKSSYNESSYKEISVYIFVFLQKKTTKKQEEIISEAMKTFIIYFVPHT